MPETDWGWLIDKPELKSWIELEDSDVLLVNKPALVVCHPSKKGPWSSLAGACGEYLNQDKTFLVSRLDRETSGIVLFAKRKPVTRLLQMALERRAVSKTYLAILEGELNWPITVDAPIGPDKNSLVRSKNCIRWDGRKQEASTAYSPLRSGNGYTLAKVTPITGRKHQIRAHAQHMGYPIVGDKLYGPDETLFLDFIDDGWTEKLEKELTINRHCLHAYRMTFHLEHGDHTFMAPLSQDLREFCCERMDMTQEEIDQLLTTV
ncbi:RluA family pseudouridine synthase [Puniceicoccaceae bacterium K14]|nr:RluA family pseudouridine synthase [Puniceicoccaceae bacterium K14]